jgi:hypothetical protein
MPLLCSVLELDGLLALSRQQDRDWLPALYRMRELHVERLLGQERRVLRLHLLLWLRGPERERLSHPERTLFP